MQHRLTITAFLFLFSIASTFAESLDVRHFAFESEQEKYMEGIIELALSYSQTPVNFQLNPSASYTSLNQQQMIKRIEENDISVMWSGTSIALEKNLKTYSYPTL